jgi:hypothetical protein
LAHSLSMLRCGRPSYLRSSSISIVSCGHHIGVQVWSVTRTRSPVRGHPYAVTRTRLWPSHILGFDRHPYSAVTVTHTQLWPSHILRCDRHTQLWPSPILSCDRHPYSLLPGTQLRHSSIFSYGYSNRDKFSARGAPRGLQRDVVNLGWPLAPSYVSQNAGGGGWAAMSIAVHRGTSKLWRSNSIFNLWVRLSRSILV